MPDRFVSGVLGRAGGTSESAVFEANANLSKMLIFDFFQISGTQTEL